MINFVMPDLYPASAEIFLLIMACVVLLIDLFSGGGAGWRPARPADLPGRLLRHHLHPRRAGGDDLQQHVRR
jgi:hypothetical protein